MGDVPNRRYAMLTRIAMTAALVLLVTTTGVGCEGATEPCTEQVEIISIEWNDPDYQEKVDRVESLKASGWTCELWTPTPKDGTGRYTCTICE